MIKNYKYNKIIIINLFYLNCMLMMIKMIFIILKRNFKWNFKVKTSHIILLNKKTNNKHKYPIIY